MEAAHYFFAGGLSIDTMTIEQLRTQTVDSNYLDELIGILQEVVSAILMMTLRLHRSFDDILVQSFLR